MPSSSMLTTNRVFLLFDLPSRPRRLTTFVHSYCDLSPLPSAATIGDINTTRPGMFDLTGKAKWLVTHIRVSLSAYLICLPIRDAWNGHKGKTEEEAKKAYVAKLISVCPPTTLLSSPVIHPFSCWKKTKTTRERRNILLSSNKQGQ